MESLDESREEIWGSLPIKAYHRDNIWFCPMYNFAPRDTYGVRLINPELFFKQSDTEWWESLTDTTKAQVTRWIESELRRRYDSRTD